MRSHFGLFGGRGWWLRATCYVQAIFDAAAEGHLEVVTWLLEKGADMEQASERCIWER